MTASIVLRDTNRCFLGSAPEPPFIVLAEPVVLLLESLIFPHRFIVRLNQPTALFDQFLHRFDDFLRAILIHKARFYVKAIDTS